jgi:hypothetical protein
MQWFTGKKNRAFKRSVCDTRGSRLMGFAEFPRFKAVALAVKNNGAF